MKAIVILLAVGAIGEMNSLRIRVLPSIPLLTNMNLPLSVPIIQPSKLPTVKLPVWPVWAGVISQVLDWLGQSSLSNWVTESVGGRVVPMDLSGTNSSPFILLVHHTHSFMPLDPVRALTTLLLPEGFPAHPHSGFDTVTYCIEGGLKHRDSEGLKMTYGNGDTQWMRAGRGVMHEEMWDTGPYWEFKKIELFQLWVNLKTKSKNNEPLCQVLQANSVPVCTSANGASLKVLCGEVECDDVSFTGPGSQVADSPMVIAHVLIPPQQRVLLEAPAMSSALVYIRKGSMVNRSDDLSESFQKYDLLSYKDNSNSLETPMMIDLLSGDSGVEALVLLAEPLNEPVIMGGPMVESTEIGYELSRRVFNTVNEEKGYWDHQITDEDWLKHIRKLDLQGIIRSIKNI